MQHSMSMIIDDVEATAGCRGDDADTNVQTWSVVHVSGCSCLCYCGCDVRVSEHCAATLDVPVSLCSAVGFWDMGLRMALGVTRYLLMKYMYRISGQRFRLCLKTLVHG